MFVLSLKNFYDVTLTFIYPLKVNTNFFFSELSKIENLLLDWMGEKDATLSGMANSMKVKLNNYWGSIKKINNFLFIARVLDH